MNKYCRETIICLYGYGTIINLTPYALSDFLRQEIEGGAFSKRKNSVAEPGTGNLPWEDVTRQTNGV